MKLIKKTILAVAVLCLSASAWAQASRPVSIIIGFAPGGVIDKFTRQIGPKLGEALGQAVIIENKPGANGVLAMEHVAKAAADGSTILMGAAGNISLNELFYPSLPYNLERDFAPVTQVNSVSLLFVVNSSVPVKTVREFVNYIKANPGKVNYASSGNGSSPNLAGEMFNSSAAVKTTHVPYKGAGLAMNDLLSGTVQFTLDAVAIGLPHVKTGRLTALATTGSQRMAILPDVPTVAESLPGFEVINWYGMLVPKATPAATVKRIQESVYGVVHERSMRAQILADGMEPVASTPAEFARFIGSEKTKWGKLIKEAGIQGS